MHGPGWLTGSLPVLVSRAGRVMLRSVAAILPLLAGAERAAAEATHAPPLLVLQDYGIYETRVGGYGPAPGNSSGVLDVIEEEHLVRQTHEVCAMLGTSFGIRFGIAGAGGRSPPCRSRSSSCIRP